MSQANSAPPILNTPPAVYDQAYMQQLVNTLRTTLSQSASNLSNTNNNATTGNTLAWMDAPGMNQQAVANQIATTVPAKNFLINSGCEVAQRGNVAAANAVATYGGCDRFLNLLTGFTTVSGTWQQLSGGSSNWSATGYGQGVGSLTTTGSGYVVFYQRLESKDSIPLSGQTVTVSFNVYHTVGATIQAGVNFLNPTALDNWTSSTVFGGGPTSPAPNGVVTACSTTFTIPAGAANLGLAVEIYFYLTAPATNALVDIGNPKLEIGSTPTPFVPEPIWQAQAACERYYQKVVAGMSGNVTSGTSYFAPMVFSPTMRAPPTMTWIAVYDNIAFPVTAPAYTVYDARGGRTTKVAVATQNGLYIDESWASAEL